MKFGNWQLDPADMSLTGSDHCKASLGLNPRDSFSYEIFRSAIHPEDRARVEEAIRCAISRIGECEVECRCIWPDGSVHWIEAWGQAIGADGKAIRMTGVMLDVTESRQSQEQYRTLFESIDEGFCIIQIMFEGERAVNYRFLKINSSFERETGLKDALGKTLQEIIPDHEEEHWVEICSRVDHTREALRFENYSPCLQRWFNVFAFPIPDHESHQVGLLFSNITDRKRAEQALRYHSEEIETLLHTSPLGIILVDSDFRIRELNPVARALFGEISDGLVGRDFEEVMYLCWERRYSREVVRVFRHTLKTGEPYSVQERAERRIDRNIIEYYEGHLSRITLPDGTYGVVCYARDVSSRVQARKEIERSRNMLRELDRRKDEFLAMLAHELRNPLAPILNAAQILQRTGSHMETIRSASAMLQRQVGQMVRLVDDLLDVSRITKGKIELRKEKVELSSIVNLAVEAVRPLLNSMEHELTIDTPPHPVYLNADPARLIQVIGNLLNNACKFTQQGGKVWLRTGLEGGHIVIRVGDNGIGIPRTQLSNIFEMFTQIDQSLERPKGGLGIGLTLVKNLVQMHEGTVEARSEGIGKGSEFVVRLPVMAEHQESGRVESSFPKQGAGVSRRVLLVDDNRDLTESLAMLLEMCGHQVQVAADGLEGVNAAMKFQPDVVLLDIGLPKLNGYEAARQIREQQKGKPALLVAISGWGQEEDRRRSKEAGFNAHIVKPVDPNVLARLVAEANV